jgi:hypothetical protein
MRPVMKNEKLNRMLEGFASKRIVAPALSRCTLDLLSEQRDGFSQRTNMTRVIEVAVSPDRERKTIFDFL